MRPGIADRHANLKGANTMFRHILIPTDGSAHAKRAIEQGMALAKALGARVTFLTVVEPFHVFSLDPKHVSEARSSYEQLAKAEATRVLAEADKVAQQHGIAYATAQKEHEHPHQAILDAAAKGGCDLIVMGSHGRRGALALVLGSVTAKVLAHSPLPVLIYR
jgi:nucleotide-binding universal stress UspA family protein